MSLSSNTRIFVALKPVDMRGSFDALAGHVRRLAREPLDGHLYFFVNRRRQLMKMIWFERLGWRIFSCRLERGTFQFPEVEPDVRQVAIEPAQLAMILDGIDLRAPRRRRYRHPGPHR